mgnify:FL=1
MTDVILDVTGTAKGVFLSINGQGSVHFTEVHIAYSAGKDTSFPSFGLFEGDNFNASFTNLRINDISLAQAALFTINANTAGKKFMGEWHLTIINSRLKSMNLLGVLIVIHSNNDLPNALDNLSITIKNTSFLKVAWLGSSNGLVSSSTQRIGRSFDNAVNSAILFDNCTFADIAGSSGLIISTLEPLFDSVALIMNCWFVSITASVQGAIINPSKGLLSLNITNRVMINESSKRQPTFKIVRNIFQKISSLRDFASLEKRAKRNLYRI